MKLTLKKFLPMFCALAGGMSNDCSAAAQPSAQPPGGPAISQPPGGPVMTPDFEDKLKKNISRGLQASLQKELENDPELMKRFLDYKTPTFNMQQGIAKEEGGIVADIWITTGIDFTIQQAVKKALAAKTITLQQIISYVKDRVPFQVQRKFGSDGVIQEIQKK